MKKIFLFLSILTCALAGVFVACDSNPYADLKVVVNSVTYASSGDAVEYDSTSKSYILYYNDEVVISARATCSTAISSTLVFNNYNESSLENTSTASRTLTVKATAPSRGSKYRINISSNESSTGNVDVYFQVKLPVTEIGVTQRLAVTYNYPLEISDNITYSSSYITSSGTGASYEVDEKGVTYNLLSYTDALGTQFALVTKDDVEGVYYIQNANGTVESTPAFIITDGVLNVQDESLEGSIQVEVRSERYDENLDENLENNSTLTQAEKNVLKEANDKLKYVVEIELVKPICLDDISFVSSQYSYGTEGDVKLSGLLYNNSSEGTYDVDSLTYNYSNEAISFKVNTSENITVLTQSGSIVKNNLTYESNSNVYSVVQTDGGYETVNGVVVSRTRNFTLNAGSAGTAYIDFVITLTDFNNVIAFKFSELYSEYLDSLSEEQLEDLNDYELTSKLVLNVSSLPTAIIVEKDDVAVTQATEGLKIYDSYSSTYGQKFEVSLTANSGTLTENKIVRVYLSDEELSGADVSDYFVVKSSTGSVKNLTSTTKDGVTMTYFDLDLSKSEDKTFYVKAKNDATTPLVEGKSFSFIFENLISSKVVAYDGSDVTNSTITNLSTSFDTTTNKGVTEILVKTKIDASFISLDSESASSNASAYQSLVLEYNSSNSAISTDGTLLSYMIEEGLSNDITLTYDEDYLTVFEDGIVADFSGDTSTSSYQRFLLSVVGKALGSTTIVFTAENGYSVTVNVKVVTAFSSDIQLNANQVYGEKYITQGITSGSGYIQEDTVSIKNGGAFDLTYTSYSNGSAVDRTGVVGSPVFASSETAIATISKNGKVTAVSEGETIIFMTITYYSFAKVNGYYQWTATTETKYFTLQVFIPTSVKGLNKYSVNVYDYNSLGEGYKSYALVGVSVKIDSASTIAKAENIATAITYNSDSSDVTSYLKNSVLSGLNFNAYSYLQSTEEDYKKVILTFTINEFGLTTTFDCAVNIYRAEQVREIELSGRDDDGDLLSLSEYDGAYSSARGSFVTTARVEDELTFYSAINPQDVLVDTLTAVVYKANANLSLGDKDTDKTFASLTYNSNNNQSEIVVSGEDDFTLNIKTGVSGFFYLIVYANDSAISSSGGNIVYSVYVKLLIEITDGSIEHQYVIYNSEDLANIADDADENYVLGSNILISEVWTPISNFNGVLNGYNSSTGEFYKISGLKLYNMGSENIGLFGQIGLAGAVLNLEVEVTYVTLEASTLSFTSDVNVGVIAGKNSGLIMNCSVSFSSFTVAISSNNVNVGGLVGNNEGSIFNFSSGLSSSVEDVADLYNDGKVNTAINLETLLGSTPVSGSMKVSDSSIKKVNVGGIAGVSSGYINGLYGVYNYINETRNLSTFTSFQNDGFDVDVNINSGVSSKVGTIQNGDSSIGGIVGLVTGGKITNVASTGSIGSMTLSTISSLKGARNNVGGIIGKVAGNTSQVIVQNVLASMAVRGKQNVGGVAGSANNTAFYDVRVENYGEDGNSTLVAGETYVGGVAGSSTNCYYELVYSYSYIDKTNSSYMTYGDVYAYGVAPFAGGIAGSATTNNDFGHAKSLFSNFNIMCAESSTGGSLAGLLGLANVGDVDEFSYVGVVSLLGDNAVNAVMNVSGSSDVSTNFNGYYYFYLLQYALVGEDYILVLPTSTETLTYSSDACVAGDMGEDVYSSDEYVEFSFYVYDETDEIYNLNTVTKKGFQYKVDNTDVYYHFLKVVPTAISLDIKGTDATLVGDDYNLTFVTNSTKNYYFDYTSDGSLYLVMTYSENNNEFDLSDIFSVTSTPSGITRFNLVASSSNTNVLSVTNAGTLLVKSAGMVTLTIYVMENSAVSKVVSVIIVNDFDELLLSSNINYSDSYFDSTDAQTTNVAIGSTVNVFTDLVKKVYEDSSVASSEGYENNYTLSTILNKNSFTVNFTVMFYNTATMEYQDVTNDDAYFEKDGQAFSFKMNGKYKIQATVSFVSNTKTYIFTNDAWVFYLNAVTQATDIWFGSSRTLLKSTGTANVTLTLESENAMEISFKVLEGGIESNIFDIAVTSAESATKQGGAYFYQVQISLKDEYKNVTELAEYTVLAYDDQECLILDPAILVIVVGPQSVDDVSLVHYAYTDKTSKLINTVNTQTYVSPNYSYSFTEESSSYIISGSEGLVVIDLYPFYANIASVTIESGLGDVGEGVKFVQMVQIGTNTNDNYYINGPTTTQTANGGISLNLVSYVPSNVATLNINAYGQSTMNLTATEMSYAFGNESENAEWGRLYVKTIAPSSLSNDSSFVIKVTITYTSIDSEETVTEKVWNETTTLSVESVPGLSLEVTHEGVEREMIAFTGQDALSSSKEDYLTLTPVIAEGQEFNSIVVTVTRGNTEIEDASEYVNVSSKNDGTYLLRLGTKAIVGDIITLKLIADVDYDNYTIEKSYIVRITVVDVVINGVTIRNIDANNNLKLTIATTSSLKVDVDGFGLDSALTSAGNSIARNMSEGGTIRYWYASVNGYESLTNAGVEDYLPFDIEYKELESGGTTVTSAEVNSQCLGVSSAQETFTFNTKQQMVVLVAGNDSESIDMRLEFSYVYQDGEILFVPNYVTDTTYHIEQDFTIYVTQGEQEENLIVIDTADEFKAMSKNGNYILMTDLSFDNYSPINAEFASFDGNNKIITINSFNYETSLSSSTSDYSINLGLFDTVSSGTIVKNVIVALPNNKTESSTRLYESAMDLTSYNSTVNFGGITAENYGIITNCEVIAVHTSTSEKSDYESAVNNYNDTVGTYNYGYTFDYTLYVKTNSTATVNIGGLVGINGSTGIITNSRVGRDEVTLLDVSDDSSVIANEYSYELTASRMIISVYGAGNVGGFVATNLGSISSSFAKNLQIEVFASENGASNIHTAGFVVANSGYIYGSYVAGWEEVSTASDSSDNRKLGGGIFSNGKIAGFVYENSNYIEDCYSNINLSGSYTFAASTAKVVADYEDSGATSAFNPTASGFVYKMDEAGYIYTSYSLSKIYGASNNHTYFEGNLQASGESDTDDYVGVLEDCYYLKESGEISNSSSDGRAWELSDNPVVDASGTQSSGLNEFVNEDSFNNFCFDSSDDTFENIIENSTGGVWTIYSNGLGGYPELISANKVAISCRVMNALSSDEDATTNVKSFSYVENYAIGTSVNPYLVADFNDYNTIFKDVSAQGGLSDTVSSKFTGSIRLINNIIFPSSTSQTVYSTTVEYTSLVSSVSIFDGNYLTMYNITLTDSNVGKVSFGLFRDIYNAGVKNLTLGINAVTAANAVTVGGLAGIIVDSNISNVKIVAGSSSSQILGKNYVGGLAGIILASNSDESYSISRIKTNISVKGDSNSSTSAITSSFEIWDAIKPIGTSSTGNLILSNLNTNMNYAGGVAGVVDLRQFSELGDSAANAEPNITNITVGEMVQSSSLSGTTSFTNGNVEILSDYAGGLFGFVGTQTYLANSSFVVSSTSKLTSYEVAGGITAINFGTLSKTSVTYNDDDADTSNLNITNFVAGGEYVSDVNENLFSLGSPTYIGGLVGINAGNETSGSGRILDSYNRLDVKNVNAIAVGGIVGASYVGEIKNVYTTASLMADLDTTEQVYIGGIIGRIFDESTGEYFQEVETSGSTGGQSYQLDLSYVVALNIWDSDDYEDLFEYTQEDDEDNVIGALYGKYENSTDGEELGIVSVNDGVYVQQFILDSFDYDYISQLNISEVDFDESELITTDDDENQTVHYIQLWGVSDNAGSGNYDSYLYSNLCGNSGSNLIFPNKLQDLLESSTSSGSDLISYNSTLRDTYFSPDGWLESTWNNSEENMLPLLKYGYESSLIRIYTAKQFVQELSSPDTLSKKYIIMNDIDFTGIDMSVFTEPFRGTLSGNAVTIEENGVEYSRYPILFNITLAGVDLTSDFAIFESTVDATISNLNFVISSYSAVFSSAVKTETKASVIVANAINTTITDVNIYSSLNDVVSEDISLTPEVLDGKTHYVTSAVMTNELNSVVDYSTPFLQVVTLNPLTTVSTSTSARDLHFKYFFTFTSEETVNSVLTYTYDLSYAINTLITGDTSLISLTSISVGEDDYTSIKNALNSRGLATNASCVGQFVAASDTSILNIANCSTTLNLTVIYTSSSAYRTKYVGAFVGNCIGNMTKMFSSSDVSITCDYAVNTTNGDFDIFYAGGAVGRMQGSMESIFAKNVTMSVGTAQRKLLTTNTGSGGIFVGGLVGAAGEYVTIDSETKVSGSIEEVETTDIVMNVYVQGKSSVAGVVGQNRYNIVNLTIKQSTTLSSVETLNVYLGACGSSCYVGGVLGDNLASELNNVYSNMSIKVVADLCDAVYVGGIVAVLTKSCSFVNVINDADYLNVSRVKTNGSYVTTLLAVGGITGGVLGSNASTITLNKVITMMDIVCDQEKAMYVGGAVGKAETISLSNVIVLGDVTLNRGNGSKSGSYFYTDSDSDEDYFYYIGGLVGMYSKYICGEIDGSTLVASTIRDYAIAQKLDLNIGSVVGRENVDNSTTTDALVSHKNNKKTYYNENISLVNCDTYVNDEFTGVSQSELLSIFQSIYKDIMIKSDYFESTYDSDYYSKLHTSYFTGNGVTAQITSNSNYISGSKINPITFISSTTLADDSYYILQGDIQLQSSITTTATGFVFNGQGYSALATNVPLFSTITENSAVCAIFSTLNSTNATGVPAYAPIAKDNYGFVFSCGTSGTITGLTGQNSGGRTGLIHTNYGVISTCFSIATITATSGAGIVLNNGLTNANKLGNIYNTYFTGEVKSASGTNSGSYFSGFAVYSTYGTISNCYTMADVDAENQMIAPISYLGSSDTSENTYRTYYDYLPTSFGSQEGVNASNVDLSDNTDCIQSKGLYVYSYSLSGETSDTSYVDTSSMFSTHWIIPNETTSSSSTSTDSELISLFKKSEKYTSNTLETIKIDSTWFNYAYVSKNFKNVILASELDDYFDMIYTGNGLSDSTNEDEITNTFMDMPYKIKHSGMLEMYILINYLKTSPEYKYYIFTKNINFEKYSGDMYWSKHLDEKKAYFVGDLDGNGKVVYNMYSSNGLLRALPNIENVNSGTKKTLVHDITFTACYAQTGLVAGYMGNGVLSGIDVDSTISSIGKNSYVYNGDLSNIAETGMFTEGIFEERISLVEVNFTGSSDKTISRSLSGSEVAFAGGLIGYMEGGEISTTAVVNGGTTSYVGADFMGLFVMVNDRTYTDESYAGGLVGVMVGGKIYGTEENEFEVKGISVYSCLDNGVLTDDEGQSISRPVSSSHIGGVVGLLSTYMKIAGELSYITVSSAEGSSSVGLYGFYTIGGIAGFNDGGTITNCVYDADDEVDVAGVIVSQNDVGIATITKSTVNENSTMSNLIANEIYIGGIAGKFKAGLIENCLYGQNADFEVIVCYLGGYHSVIFGGIVGDLYQSSKTNTATINNCYSAGRATVRSVKTSIVGGIVGRMRGGILTNCNTGYYLSGSTLVESQDSKFVSSVYFSLDNVSWILPSVITNWIDGVEDFGTLWNSYWASKNWLSSTLTYYPTSLSTSVSYSDLVDSSGKTTETGGYDSLSIGGTFSSYGYSVTGGIVGRMQYGTLDGTGEEVGEYTISNNASIEASSSAGGIVGEVIVTETDGSKKVNIINVKDTGDVYGLSTLNISADLNVKTTLDPTYSYNYVKEEANLVDLLLEADFYISLKESRSGGIVGYVYSSTGSNVSGAVVTIDKCVTDAEVIGGILSTFAGGIVALCADATLNEHVVISSCESSASYLGYPLKSFAGGIVGYSNYSTIIDCKTGSWSAISIISGNTKTSLTDMLEDLFDNEDEEDTAEETISFFTLAETFLSTPYILGGIVGYLQNGLVQDCSTETGIMMASRVAGGMIGVMTGGILKSTGIMINQSVVYALSGIAGGIVGLMRGGVIDTGISLENSDILSKIVDIFKNLITGDTLIESLEEVNAESGLIINSATGIIMGYCSGGIIGYYEHMDTYSTGNVLTEEPELAGVFNLGSAVSGIGMLFATNKVAESSSSNITEDGNWLTNMGKWLSNTIDKFLQEWSIEVVIDGEEVLGLSTNFLECFSTNLSTLWNLTFSGVDVGTAGYKITSYLSNIIVPDYKWTADVGLYYPDTEETMASDNFVLNEEEYASIGQGACGGIIGIVKTTDKLTLNAVVSYAINLSSSEVTSQSLFTVASGRIASAGSAGGLVGACLVADLLNYDTTEEQLIISFAFNFTPVLGRENAGGIVGYAEQSTFIYSGSELEVGDYFDGSFLSEGYLRGWVANYGDVSADGNAGGIIGRSVGANLNSKAVETLYSPHLVEIVANAGGFVSDKVLKSEISQNNTYLCPYIISSGSVSGAKRSGGIVGYATDNTCLYFCKTTLSPLAFLTFEDFSWGDLLNLNMSIAGSKYVGGLVGEMDDNGIISGTCYVGSQNDNFITRVFKVVIYGFKETGAENESCAGGIVGKVSASAKIGGLIGNEETNTLCSVYVGNNVHFGASSSLTASLLSFYPAYVGGSIGLVENDLPDDYYVEIACTVSGGEIAVGGWFGLVDLGVGKTLDLSKIVDGVSVNTNTNTTLKVGGTKTSLSSLDDIVSGALTDATSTVFDEASAIGGVVGYLKSGTLTGVNVIHSVTGETGNIVGGVVGKLGTGGLITNVNVWALDDGAIVYSTLVSGSTVNNKTVSNNGLALGGIVGYMEGGFINNATVTKVSLSGAKYVGGVVGYMKAGTIGKTLAVVGGEIGTATYGGGIVGYLEGEGEDCVLTNVVSKGVNVTDGAKAVITSGADYAGGYVGFMNGGTFCFTTTMGNAFYAGSDYGIVYGNYIAGGLVAEMQNGTIEDGDTSELTIKTGEVYDDEVIALGGLVGKMTGGTIIGGTAPTSISGTTVGGLVGWMTSHEEKDDGGNTITLSGTLNGGTSGTVTASSDNSYAGGFVGRMDAGEIIWADSAENSIVTNLSNVQNVALGGVVGIMTGGTITGGVEPLTVQGTGSAQTLYGGGVIGELTVTDESADRDVYTLEISAQLETSVSGVYYGGGLIGKASDGIISSVAKAGSTVSATYAGGLIGFAGGGEEFSVVINVDEIPNITLIGKTAVGGAIGLASNAQVAFKNSTISVSGTFSATDSTNFIGGIIGMSVGTRVGPAGYDDTIGPEDINNPSTTTSLNTFSTTVNLKNLTLTTTAGTTIGGVIGIMEGGSVFAFKLGESTGATISVGDEILAFGGIVGKNSPSGSGAETSKGIIYGCENKYEITLNSSVENANLGGICGVNESYIYYSTNSASITSNFASIGGISGKNTGSVIYCKNGSSGVATTLTASSKSILGGIVGTSEGSGKVTTGCTNFASLSLGENSSSSIVDSSLWEGSSSSKLEQKLTDDDTTYNNSSEFKNVYSGAVGGIAGKISGSSYVCGTNNGTVSGYYYYFVNLEAGKTISFSESDIEEVETYEIVDRRGNIVGWNDNSVESGAKAVNEAVANGTLGSWLTDSGGDGVKTITWADRQEIIVDDGKDAQVGYVVVVSVTTTKSVPIYDGEIITGYEYETIGTTKYYNHMTISSATNAANSYELIKTNYEAISPESLMSGIEALGLTEGSTGTYLQSQAATHSLEVLGSSVATSSLDYIPAAGDGIVKVQTTLTVYKVTTTYFDAGYSATAMQDCGGDVSYARDVYKKQGYVTDLTSKAVALEKVYELDNVTSSEDLVEDEWDMTYLPTGVLFKYDVVDVI